jgi:leucyl-tRNA synthetase
MFRTNSPASFYEAYSLTGLALRSIPNGGIFIRANAPPAVMHLLYARFFTKIARDAKMISVGEPFGKLVCQGMLNSDTPFCSNCNADYHVEYFDKKCPTCDKPLGQRKAKMSKSLGNTVSPGKMINIYGADTVRLFILFGANPEAGMDWSDSVLEANHRQMHSIIEAINSAISLNKSPSKMDDWILAKLRNNYFLWKEAMSKVSIREGVMLSHFTMLSDWNWYRRRGGCDSQTAQLFLQVWLPMLAPITPHLAEEFWHRLDQDGYLAAHNMPEYEVFENDSFILSQEHFLRNVIDTARNVKGLAQRHTDSDIKSLIIQTSPMWKYDLAKEAITLEVKGFDFKSHGTSYIKSLPIFSKEEMRGEIFHMWSTLTVGNKKKRGKVHTWSEEDKALIMSTLDETSFLFSNSDFLVKELDLEFISIYEVGKGEDVADKARVAVPLEPGIAFT